MTARASVAQALARIAAELNRVGAEVVALVNVGGALLTGGLFAAEVASQGTDDLNRVAEHPRVRPAYAQLRQTGLQV